MTKLSYYKSPWGVLCIEDNCQEIVSLRLACDNDFVEANDSPLILKFKSQLDEYFEGKRLVFDIPHKANGTEFQQRVWQALSEIPYGRTCSYKQIAIQIGNAKASRAVGLACNKNPLLLIIPCHRVIASSGNLTGYTGGLVMKESLLKLENLHKTV
ncbi:MAG: methylated-DNA--[protein]-cysteine S-methyltransferase [Opitutales bacterium]